MLLEINVSCSTVSQKLLRNTSLVRKAARPLLRSSLRHFCWRQRLLRPPRLYISIFLKIDVIFITLQSIELGTESGNTTNGASDAIDHGTGQTKQVWT